MTEILTLSKYRHAEDLYETLWSEGVSRIIPFATMSNNFQHGNLVINTDNDHWILQEGLTLKEQGFGTFILQAVLQDQCQSIVENEIEISYFNRNAYDEFRKDPTFKW